MPNGESKNWVRFTITLEAFYTMYKRWPSTVHLYPFFIDELKDKLSSADFQTLNSKIKLITDEEEPFLAIDEEGNRFSYAKEPLPTQRKLVIRAIDWLEINEPDYYD